MFAGWKMALARDRKAISAKIIDLNGIGLGASIFGFQPLLSGSGNKVQCTHGLVSTVPA